MDYESVCGASAIIHSGYLSSCIPVCGPGREGRNYLRDNWRHQGGEVNRDTAGPPGPPRSRRLTRAKDLHVPGRAGYRSLTESESEDGIRSWIERENAFFKSAKTNWVNKFRSGFEERGRRDAEGVKSPWLEREVPTVFIWGIFFCGDNSSGSIKKSRRNWIGRDHLSAGTTTWLSFIIYDGLNPSAGGNFHPRFSKLFRIFALLSLSLSLPNPFAGRAMSLGPPFGCGRPPRSFVFILLRNASIVLTYANRTVLDCTFYEWVQWAPLFVRQPRRNGTWAVIVVSEQTSRTSPPSSHKSRRVYNLSSFRLHERRDFREAVQIEGFSDAPESAATVSNPRTRREHPPGVTKLCRIILLN